MPISYVFSIGLSQGLDEVSFGAGFVREEVLGVPLLALLIELVRKVERVGTCHRPSGTYELMA